MSVKDRNDTLQILIQLLMEELCTEVFLEGSVDKFVIHPVLVHDAQIVDSIVDEVIHGSSPKIVLLVHELEEVIHIVVSEGYFAAAVRFRAEE